MTTDETAKKYLLEILAEHVGAENKIARRELWYEMNYRTGGPVDIEEYLEDNLPLFPDRRMRALIAELRTTPKGRWIVASQKDGGGYFIAKDMDEAREYIAPDYSRCYTKLKGLSKQMKLIGLEISPQMELEI